MSYGERVLLGEDIQSLSDYMSGSAEAHTRFGKKVCVYSPKEFQLNLAFSRAYIIESGGKRVGLEHPSLYVDGAALDPLPIFLYHRASFLSLLGEKDQSRQIFASFVKEQGEFKVEQIDKVLLDYEGTNIEGALSHAKREITM